MFSQNIVFSRDLHHYKWIIQCYSVQPLENTSSCSVFLATSFITCIMTSACFFSHMEKVEKMCWAEVKHSHSNTMASISLKVNPVVESILPNLLRLLPRCNQYCLSNSFILSPCKVETVLTLSVDNNWQYLAGCNNYLISYAFYYIHSVFLPFYTQSGEYWNSTTLTVYLWINSFPILFYSVFW